MLERVASAYRTLPMSQTIAVSQLPGPAPVAPRTFRHRVPALTSLVSKAFAAYGINGAIKALDAPGNPFTVEYLI